MSSRSSGKRKGKIMTNTDHKIMIRIEEIDRALNKEEVAMFHQLVGKIGRFDAGGVSNGRSL